MRRRVHMRAGQLLSRSEHLGGGYRVPPGPFLYRRLGGAGRLQRRWVLVSSRRLLADRRAVLAWQLWHVAKRKHIFRRRLRRRLHV